MKKVTIAILAAAVVLSGSCANRQSKKAEQQQTEETSLAEQYLTEDLKINLANLAESLSKVKDMPYVNDIKDGKVVLSDKEKMIVPDYLLPLEEADKFVTLSQKYRAYMIYDMDSRIASLYGMPLDGYKATLNKLAADINDPNFEIITEGFKEGNVEASIKSYYDACAKDGRLNFFWEVAATNLVEETYLLTKNTDKLLPLFDDETAADVTYRFILVHDGITSLINYHPEMAALNEVLTPLYKINAINVEQFREQLLSIKDDIQIARNKLIE